MKRVCPFCTTSINDAVFMSSPNFLAIYNIAPVLPGHSMVIPKKHISGIMDLTEEELTEMVSFSRDVVKLLLKVFKADSFDWTIQEGKPAGQTIDHLHLHIIPRTEGDLPEPGDWYPKLERSESKNIDSADRKRISKEQMKEIMRKLKGTQE